MGSITQRANASSQQLTSHSTYKLQSGFEIPVLGYGVFRTAPDTTSAVVQEAIKIGFRHVDCAAFYGNEREVAEGLLRSGVPREQIFFTSKIHPEVTSYEGAKDLIERTISNIGDLGYVDLMLIHSPYGGETGRLGVWKALAEAVEEGNIRSIGVSNYGISHLEELERHIQEIEGRAGKGKGGILSVNQVELHPWLNRSAIVKWCQSRGILVQAWAPLAQATRWGDPILQNIIKRTGKTEAQILLRWSLQKGFNPLPKSITPARIKENFDVFDFALTEEEMETLETDEYDSHGWDPTTSGL